MTTTTTTPTVPAEPPWGHEQHAEAMLAIYSQLTTRQRQVLRASARTGIWPGRWSGQHIGAATVSRRTADALRRAGLIAWRERVGYRPTEMGLRVLAARFGEEV